MKSIIILLTIIAILCVSCKQNNTNEILDTSFITPLKVGNYWVYRHISFDSTGSVKYDFNETTTVLKDTVIESQECFQVATPYSGTIMDTAYAYNLKDGYYKKEWFMIVDSNGYITGFNLRTTMTYQYPGKVGDQFKFFSLILTIDSINIPHYFHGINYTCYRYSYSHIDTINPRNNFDGIFWVAPGIGLLETVSFSKSNPNNIYKAGKSELLDYKLY